MKRIIVLLFVLLLAACVTPPTQSEQATADYGTPITQADAQAQAKQEYFDKYLKDPSSAQYQWGQVKQAWYGVGIMANGNGNVDYGYVLDVNVNAKNSFGGYTGFITYRFMFHSGQIISIGRQNNDLGFPMMGQIYHR